MPRGFFERYQRARSNRPSLDYLLAQASPDAALRDRLLWLIDLLQWTRRPARLVRSPLDFGSGQGQSARVRHLLKVLDANPVAKLNVARTLRSLVRDVDAVDLFRGTGVLSGFGLGSEFWERLWGRWTPRYYEGSDLGEAFDMLFPDPKDAVWIERLDDDTLVRIGALFAHRARREDLGWNSLLRELSEAIVLLSDEVRVIGMSGKMRRELPDDHRRVSPFAALSDEARILTRVLIEGDETASLRELRAFQQLLAACRRELDGIRSQLKERGISLALVYQIERLEDMLERNRILAGLLASRGHSPREISRFIVRLINENDSRRHLRPLLADASTLLARRITERNALTGEHYITRNKSQYLDMVRRAAGGGVITGATVVFKLAIDTVSLGNLMKSVLFAGNYASSFLLIQACGFTLATKQPAMTAATLAEALGDVDNEDQRQAVVNEVVHLIRSQTAAIVGNVVTVVPIVAAIHYLYFYLNGSPFLTVEQARGIVDSHSIWGPTPIFAAFTGVLLWLSSVFAGLVDNWVAYRRLPEALAAHRGLAIVFGRQRVDRWANMMRRQAAGIGGNLSLGILLGALPKALKTIGLPLDARHVTLSTGTVAFALLHLEAKALWEWSTILAVAGLAAAGALNVGVSFGLSLVVAESAKRLGQQSRRRLYQAIVMQMVRRPMRLFLPMGLTPDSNLPDTSHPFRERT